MTGTGDRDRGWRHRKNDFGATRRANHAATASPATAKRGRLSERAWSDVLRAARIARAEGVALRVHGIEIYNKRKPLKLKNKVLRQEQKKPTETCTRGP